MPVFHDPPRPTVLLSPRDRTCPHLLKSIIVATACLCVPLLLSELKGFSGKIHRQRTPETTRHQELSFCKVEDASLSGREKK